MAKGTRSSSKKKLNTWRREHLKPAWQDQADAARYAALQEALAAPLPPREEPVAEETEEPSSRGREGAPPSKKKQLKKMRAGMDVDDDDEEQMDDGSDAPEDNKRQGGKGRGVQKKRRAGKLFLIGQKNQFHKKRTQITRRNEKKTRAPRHK